jgi:hypothetical protein
MSEMVERVAEAIVAEMAQQTRMSAPTNAALSKSAIEVARAAIEAMREPTSEMSEAAFQIEASGHSQRTLLEAGWRAMIDAALDPMDCVREAGKA